MPEKKRGKSGAVAGRRVPISVSNPTFNLLICIVVGIMMMSFVGSGILAFWPPKEPTEFQKQFMSFCDIGFKTTLGAIVGLLGGRAAKPDRVEEE